MYLALAAVTRAVRIVRTLAEMRRRPVGRRARSGSCRRWARFHAGHVSLFDAARARVALVVAEPLREPDAVQRRRRTSPRYPRDEARDARIAEDAGVDVLFAPGPEARSIRPASRPGSTSTEPSRPLEGAFRPGHFRGVRPFCLKLFNIVRPHARLLRPEGRAAGRRPASHDPRPRSRRSSSARSRRCAIPTGWRLVPQRVPLARRARARARAPPRARARATRRARELLARPGVATDYVDVLRGSTAAACSPRASASGRRA